jgi:hypothetical protein
MPPGHDAWIVGDKPCVMIDFTGVAKYAKPAEQARSSSKSF